MEKQYYLATTGNPQTWGLDSSLLLLGNWCLAHEKNRALLKNKEYLIVKSPWENPYSIKEAADYCYRFYEESLPALTDQLNSLHNVSYPVRYWRILLGTWLLHFIETLYDRYMRIEDVQRKYQHFYTHVLAKEDCNFMIWDMYDFISKINCDLFNLQLFSLILHYLCPENAKVKDITLAYDDNIFFPKKTLKSQILFNYILRPLDLGSKNDINFSDMYHLNSLDMLALKFKAGIGGIGFLNFNREKKDNLKNDYSFELRKKIIFDSSKDKFQTLLYNILPFAIPVCYLENYQTNRGRIKKLNSGKIIGSAVGWFANEEFKFFSSEAFLKGAKFVEFQHGGAFGMLLSNPIESLSLEKDQFYTWGWNSDKNNKTKVLPSPYLSKLVNTYHRELDKILFIGNAVPKYIYRLHTMLLPEHMPEYFEGQKTFFRSLSGEIRNKILYRPYPADFGWNGKKIIEKEFPNLKFFTQGKVIETMQKVRLVIVDHPYTSFLEALTVNAPSVFYWDHKIHLMRPEAEGYFELLRDAGILYQEPGAAAKKINDVFLNPSDWWFSKKVQHAREVFCKHFAFTEKNWMGVWLEELNRLRNELKEYKNSR